MDMFYCNWCTKWLLDTYLTFKFYYGQEELFLRIFQMLITACGHVDVGMCPHQVLAATLTLSHPGGGGLCPPYTCVHTKFWKPQGCLVLIRIVVFKTCLRFNFPYLLDGNSILLCCLIQRRQNDSRHSVATSCTAPSDSYRPCLA